MTVMGGPEQRLCALSKMTRKYLLKCGKSVRSRRCGPASAGRSTSGAGCIAFTLLLVPGKILLPVSSYSLERNLFHKKSEVSENA